MIERGESVRRWRGNSTLFTVILNTPSEKKWMPFSFGGFWSLNCVFHSKIGAAAAAARSMLTGQIDRTRRLIVYWEQFKQFHTFFISLSPRSLDLQIFSSPLSIYWKISHMFDFNSSNPELKPFCAVQHKNTRHSNACNSSNNALRRFHWYFSSSLSLCFILVVGRNTGRYELYDADFRLDSRLLAAI